MDSIDFLPTVYRKKCTQRLWAWRRMRIAAVAGIALAVFVVFDQQSIHRRRIDVKPKLDNRLMVLDNTKFQHEATSDTISKILVEREALHSVLLNVPRSKAFAVIYANKPPGMTLTNIQLRTQPEAWIATAVTTLKEEDRTACELQRIIDVMRSSETTILLTGNVASMHDINDFEVTLSQSLLFQKVKFTETRQVGKRFEFNLQMSLINPHRDNEFEKIRVKFLQNQTTAGISGVQVEAVSNKSQPGGTLRGNSDHQQSDRTQPEICLPENGAESEPKSNNDSNLRDESELVTQLDARNNFYDR